MSGGMRNHFDDAAFHLWTMAGLSQADMKKRGVGLVVAQIKIDYIKEMTAGELLVIRHGFTQVGTKSLRHLARMYNADTEELCATEETVEVFFDPVKRVSAPMPDDIRERMTELLVDPEAG